ncbi:putative metal-dependent hydrolase [Pseudogemmatithrix spongiicola]|uniref:Metal-dependent hydrolase n=1 Tax=Pseudogemmatithrix spongiicola TaxID=3062599 RepID=A0AA49Q5Q2_9BACT|nr:putative metal-dependent hydrolase [Gemmatimonadaceae bacterium 'strain 138']WKW16089.1 putative metal-dependent hydrolase [Gemmatimonadaceae bacterium 'strain 318']
MTDDLRYPIGPWRPPTSAVTPEWRANHIRDIAELPAQMRAAVAGLDDRQLDTPYRPGGWTLRQVVHHVADSHANGFIRQKLALTESNPTVKPYDEERWAELPDAQLPIDVSLRMLDAIHERWAALLRALRPERFSAPYQHPQSGPQTLDSSLSNYSWHGRHHVAHITALRVRQSW